MLRNSFVASGIDVSGRDVFQALIISLVVVVIDKGFDPVLQDAWQEVVFRQNAVLQSLVQVLNLALGLRWHPLFHRLACPGNRHGDCNMYSWIWLTHTLMRHQVHPDW